MKGKKSFKALACILCCIMVIAMFAACSGGSTSGGGTSGGGTSGGGADNGEAAAVSEIEFFSMYEQGEPHVDYFNEMIAGFEAETGIKVNLTYSGRDVLNNIQARILAGNPPDLVDQEFSELTAALLVSADLAMPIDDLLYDTEGPEGQARMIDIFNDTFMDVYKTNGHHYFFPYEFATAGISYNKTLFNDLGLSVPKTWSEFVAVSEALKAEGIPPLALDGNINFYNAYYYSIICLRVLGPGSFAKAAEDPTGAVWDDPGYLKAAELTYELSKSGKDFFQPGYEGSNFPAAQADWAMGSSAMIMCGTWIPQETEELVDDDWVFGCFPFPGVEGGVGSSTEIESSLYGMSILQGCNNPEGAKEFLKYIARKENAQKYSDYTDLISARVDINTPETLADVKDMIANATGFFLPYDGVLGDQPEWFANVFYPLDNQLLFGDITPEEFISQMKTNSKDFWDKKQ